MSYARTFQRAKSIRNRKLKATILCVWCVCELKIDTIENRIPHKYINVLFCTSLCNVIIGGNEVKQLKKIKNKI